MARQSTKPQRLGLETNRQYFGTVSNYPEKLLNTIFCNGKKDCSAKCGCRRLGLSCSPACTNCQGQSCLNVMDEDSFVIDEETANSSLVEQFKDIQQEEEEEEEEEEEIEENMTVEVEFEEYESD
ncbi:unnamed protein product [Psylliodes chrysocephalus]|uniref:Tesmin/TSO1-like CXC domain-containing protein n=1 Tax=Psylliodes chrysocephalus TaxID=3402493 RepID=A0A9P0CG44_9CUCU|nr:unnamed protein product [Psylliodes chrysocephala]